MMRKYMRYEDYKDSGVEWMGEIPVDWRQSKYKYYYYSSMGNTILKEDLIVDGSIPIYSATESDNIFGYVNNANVILNKNDFVIPARGNSIGNVTLVADEKATCTQTTIYSKKVNNINSKYIYYFLDGLKNYLFNFTRTAIPQITVKQVSNNDILVPPKKEQQKIASFLDQKTAEINEIINKKESLIDYLEKYKKSVITEAVTKGKLGNKYINADGELVDEIEMTASGVEWIGEIPEYWYVNRIKFNNLINPNKTEINYKDMEVSFVPMEYIKDGVIEDQDSKNLDEVYDGYSYFTEQDILLAKVTPCFENNNIGIASGLKNGIGFGTTEVHVIRALDDFNRYIFYLFQSKYFKSKGKSVMYGAGGLKRVPTDFVENYFYGRPEYKIQKMISNHLDEKINQIYNLIQKTKKSIEKYKEYKKALIFEAVTGKIDLRDYELEGGEELAEHNNSSETERERISAVD
jgi:type I restriction enzyme S subunit